MSAMLAVRLEWGRLAEARLDAEMTAARARGEPVTADELAGIGPPAHSNSNGADLLSRAAAAVVISPAAEAYLDRCGDDQLRSDAAMEAAIVGDNAEPLRLAIEAVSARRVEWDARLPNPLDHLNVWPPLEPQRDLDNVLFASVRHAEEVGDDLRVLQRLRAMVNQADALMAGRPTLLTVLVADGMERSATASLRAVVSRLHLQTRESAGAARELLGQLFDDRPAATGWRRAWYGGRLYGIEAADHPPRALFPWDSWATRPLFLLGAAASFRVYSAMAAACNAPDYPAATAAILKARTQPGVTSIDWTIGTTDVTYRHAAAEPPPLTALVRSVGDWIIPGGKPVRRRFETLSDRRATGVLLALRLYQLAHDGRLPTTLGSLVPEYLPAVPADPMAAGGVPLRFIPTAGSEAVYSVGDDGVDNGGSFARNPSAAIFADGLRQPWDGLDAVYTYHPLPPVPPSVTPGS